MPSPVPSYSTGQSYGSTLAPMPGKQMIAKHRDHAKYITQDITRMLIEILLVRQAPTTCPNLEDIGFPSQMKEIKCNDEDGGTQQSAAVKSSSKCGKTGYQASWEWDWKKVRYRAVLLTCLLQPLQSSNSRMSPILLIDRFRVLRCLLFAMIIVSQGKVLTLSHS